jgi:N-acetylmuramoyl-L-alanine amidase/LGFP repeat
MRFIRQPSRLPFWRGLVTLSCGAVIASLATVTPAGAATMILRADSAPLLASAASPHAVTPTVKAHAIAPIVAGTSSATLAALRLPTAAGHLVAHVSRPVVHLFSMVAVTWNATRSLADVHVEVRTRHDGSWSTWTEIGVDGDGPSAHEDTSSRAGTSALWTGAATGVEVAVYETRGGGPLDDLQVDTIDPGSSAYDATVGRAAADASKGGGPAGTFPGMPKVVTRAQWGADESLGDKCWAPQYGSTFKAVIVHHTAGTNDYSRAQAPAVVRGVLAYHTISRGWCDIGYNFLIDRYGTVYEGRGGGLRQPVRGAHAGDYNVNTTGISLMGNFDIARPTKAMTRSLVQLVAWRLGTAYHGAYGRPFLFDGRFNRISGHRDVMETACPGRFAYAWLPTLRERVEGRLGGWTSKIEQAWAAAGGTSGTLGAVRVGEREENGGHHTTFDHGRMYFGHQGLFTFHRGPILNAYVSSGETGGELGYPTSAVHHTAAGLTADFATGRAYWSSAAGSHVMRRGAILRRYVHLDAATGSLGFPTGSIHRIPGGTRDRFEDGSISYLAASHTTTVTLR